jgi:Fe-S-cluster containining protein
MDLSTFECIQCHACCRQPGYVRLRPAEPDVMADFLEMDVHEFIETFTILTEDRTGLSLIEQPDRACIFLTDTGCRIHPVKPAQCRDFPLLWRFSGFDRICGWARSQRKADGFFCITPEFDVS